LERDGNKETLMFHIREADDWAPNWNERLISLDAGDVILVPAERVGTSKYTVEG
jgi:hypothetical protein